MMQQSRRLRGHKNDENDFRRPSDVSSGAIRRGYQRLRGNVGTPAGSRKQEIMHWCRTPLFCYHH
jgi:hypothetical protein